MSESAPSFLSGFYGTAAVAVSGTLTEFALIRWTITPTARLVEFMNSRTGLLVQRESTFRDVGGTIAIDYDFNVPLYSSAGFNIQPGITLSNMRLYLDQTSRYSGSGSGTGSLDGSYWFINQAIPDGTPQSLDNAGKIATSISWKNAGASFMYPS